MAGAALFAVLAKGADFDFVLCSAAWNLSRPCREGGMSLVAQAVLPVRFDRNRRGNTTPWAWQKKRTGKSAATASSQPYRPPAAAPEATPPVRAMFAGVHTGPSKQREQSVPLLTSDLGRRLTVSVP